MVIWDTRFHFCTMHEKHQNGFVLLTIYIHKKALINDIEVCPRTLQTHFNVVKKISNAFLWTKKAYIIRAMCQVGKYEKYLFKNVKSENKGFWLFEKTITAQSAFLLILWFKKHSYSWVLGTNTENVPIQFFKYKNIFTSDL